MTEQTPQDKKFNLEDWVTHRAANQAASDREDKQLNAVAETQPVSLPHTVQGVISMTGNGASSQVFRRTETPAPSPQNETQRSASPYVSNGIANAADAQTGPLKFTSALGTASQQIQIVRLLQDLSDRLRSSEKEREILWREIESSRKQLSDIDDKTSKTEKAYLSLENKFAAQPDHKNDLDTQKKTVEDLIAEQKKLLEKVTTIETTAGSTVLRVEDALTENHKLAKRLDQVAQDKIRLQRKLDMMEETLTQTQDALKAKALVLLTDHALAHRTALPQTPAFTEQDKERLSFLNQQQSKMVPAQAMSAAQNVNNQPSSSQPPSWWKQGDTMLSGSNTMRYAVTLGLIALGAAGGYVASKWGAQNPAPASLETVAPEAGSESNNAPQSQDELMANIADMANQIEPAANDAGGDTVIPASSLSISPESLTKIHDAEDAAVKAFESKEPKSSVAATMKPDANLPSAAKALETRALSGDGNAQHDLASLYSAGHAGVVADYKRASAWFTAAAYNGITNAQYNLGVLKQQGLGTAQDTKGAMDLYRLAARDNHAEAQYNLGIASIEGIGADYDPQIAAYYFERAAAGGIVEAAYNLGLIQENGLLGDSQPDEAVFWYKLGADNGHAESQKALAQLTKSLAMNDADVTRIFDRISQTRPNALGGKITANNKTAATNETQKPMTKDDKDFVEKMKSMF